MSRLMSREEWKEAVFARDQHACVNCGRGPQDGIKLDAHHILERKLWEDGGYFLENGVSLCDEGERGCHYKAEQTLLTCEELRSAAGISRVLLPPHLDEAQDYDKWGNEIIDAVRRGRGELFFEDQVQKILGEAGLLDTFVPYSRYPRTFHVPWSPGRSKDDKVLSSLDHFVGRRVVVTEKMDGESASIYANYLHARSPDGRHHPSRDWLKRFAAAWQYEVPENWRVIGEYMYAQHSIRYEDLASYFLMFQIWNDRNLVLSWDETGEWAKLLGLTRVPELYRGIWDEPLIRDLHQEQRGGRPSEGYVIRLEDAFPVSRFRYSVAKYVRAKHVQTDQHWMHGEIVPNLLLSE